MKGITRNKIEEIITYLDGNSEHWRDDKYSDKNGVNDRIKILSQQVFDALPDLEMLDEEKVYNFLLSLGGDLQFVYMYKGQTGNPARDVAQAICSKFSSLTLQEFMRYVPEEEILDEGCNCEECCIKFGKNACRQQIIENFERGGR